MANTNTTGKKSSHHQKQMHKVKNYSEQIADLLIDIDTDYRGNLYEAIGVKLALKTQFYSSAQFREMANEYGIKK